MKINVNDLNLFEKLIQSIKHYNCIIIDFELFFSNNVISYSTIIEYIEMNLSQYNIGVSNYVKKRLMAEKKAKRKYKDVTISEIYKHFDCEEKYKKKLKEIEIENFKKFLNKSDIIESIYKYCISNKKKVKILNRTFFSSENLQNIFQNFGIIGVDSIIKECDIPTNSLVICKPLKQIYKNDQQFIYINNDPYINKNKFRSLVKKQKMNKNERINFSVICGFINNHINKNEDYYERIGFGKFGILLYGYANFIYENAKKHSRKIYFLSRDGYIIKKAFDTLDKNKEYDSYYLYISRSSIKKALYNRTKTIDELLDMIGVRRYDSYDRIFNLLGITPEDKNDLVKKDNDKIIYKNKLIGLKSILCDLYDVIKQKSINTEQNLMAYLKGKKFYGPVVIVDLVCHGTVQHYLQKLENECSICGYYLGMLGNSKPKNMTITKFLKEVKFFNQYSGALETFFSAPHGMTINYINNSYEIKDCEYCDEEIKKLEKIQNSALCFVEKFDVFIKNLNLSLKPQECFILMYDMLYNPTPEDIKNIGIFSFDDIKISKLCENADFKYYLMHPLKFYYSYYYSTWKSAFLKNVFCNSIFSDLLKKYKKNYKN